MALTIRITPGYNWSVGELVTEEKLNLANNPTVELEGSVGSASIADGSVTLVKLAVGVLTADSAGRSRMADGFMVTAKYADGSITGVKLDESARGSIYQYAAGAYSAGVYAIALTTAPTAYTAGMVVRFKASATNDNSGDYTADLNVNSLGAKNLLTLDGKELVQGQIAANGIYEAVYDGTSFLVNLRSRYSVTVANAVSVPSVGATTNFAHGLGTTPFRFQVFLVCTTNDTASGYQTTDGPIPVEFANTSNQERAFCVRADATNISVVRNNNSAIIILNKSTGNSTSITNATNFKLIARAEL